MVDYTYPLVNLEKYKGCEWTLNGDSYEGLTWISKDMPKPTKAQLELDYTECLNLNKYKEDRRAEYPSWQDQMDLMYHGRDVWCAAIKVIKDKYPKPVE